MTKEEKELLLKDLCARQPYGIMCRIDHDPEGKYDIGIDDERFIDDRIVSVCHENEQIFVYEDEDYPYSPEEIRPYLRPMSSMTKEEKQESRWYKQNAKSDNFILYMNRYVEWLDSKHFDWRTDGNGKTMIEKGLAIESPEGMYNI